MMRSDDEYKAKHSRSCTPDQRVHQYAKKHKDEKCEHHLNSGVFCHEKPTTRQETYEQHNIDQMMRYSTKSNKINGLAFASTIIAEADARCKDMNDFYTLITPREPLHVTAHNLIQCRVAPPCVDTSIFHDLRRALNYPPFEMLKNIIQIINNTMSDASDNGSQYPLAEIQRTHMVDIWQKILTRTSYGCLFISNGKVFTLKSALGQYFPTTVKSHPLVKQNDELESPWNVAVRRTYEEIEYLNSTTGQWYAYNITEHPDHIQKCLYLECTIEYDIRRLVGLFVIRIANGIQFRSRELNVTPNTSEWIPLDADINFNEYQTFIKFIHDHPDLVLE